jgi:hypothetical protein
LLQLTVVAKKVENFRPKKGFLFSLKAGYFVLPARDKIAEYQPEQQKKATILF